MTEEYLQHYIHNRTHTPNAKPYLKYYIDKELYELFNYAIIWRNSWEIEFYTLNEDYREIWNKLRKDYGYTKLIDCEYDTNYHCYTVSVLCLELLEYLKSMHDYCNPSSENIWKTKARICNWSEAEIQEGYMEYKKRCDEWFNYHYGKHIKLF